MIIVPCATTIKFDETAYVSAKESKEARVHRVVERCCFFAFSEEQFSEGCAKFEDELDAGDRLVRIGGGCFCLKSRYRELLDACDDSSAYIRSQIVSDPDFARGAFLYEMKNHEYHINWQGDWDVCSCFTSREPKFGEDKTFNDYLAEDGFPREVIALYAEAAREMYRLADENGWY